MAPLALANFFLGTFNTCVMLTLQGYVYCGRLSYMAHAPERLPIRFVWRLDDADSLMKDSAPFQDLVKACEDMVK